MKLAKIEKNTVFRLFKIREPPKLLEFGWSMPCWKANKPKYQEKIQICPKPSRKYQISSQKWRHLVENYKNCKKRQFLLIKNSWACKTEQILMANVWLESWQAQTTRKNLIRPRASRKYQTNPQTSLVLAFTQISHFLARSWHFHSFLIFVTDGTTFTNNKTII